MYGKTMFTRMQIKGLFGSQPQFAKPNFGSHKLFGLCLVFAILVVCHTSLIIWPTCYRVNFLANSCQSVAFNFLATLFVAATLWLDKIWLGTKHPLRHSKHQVPNNWKTRKYLKSRADQTQS
jgi:hypothetical protein